MQITNEWLKEKGACRDGYEFAQTLLDRELKTICAELLTNNHYSWANWVLVRCMNKPQRVQYAIFAAREVLHIFEKKYPDDSRPRKAIEAAEAYLKDPSAASAYAAAYAAYAAADAAADAAAYAAAYAAAADDDDAAAADAAAYAAAYAAAAADAYAYAAAAAAAAYAADAYADDDARKNLQSKIVQYGIGLLEVKG